MAYPSLIEVSAVFPFAHGVFAVARRIGESDQAGHVGIGQSIANRVTDPLAGVPQFVALSEPGPRRQRIWLGRDARLVGLRARDRAARYCVRQVGPHRRDLLARGLHL